MLEVVLSTAGQSQAAPAGPAPATDSAAVATPQWLASTLSALIDEVDSGLLVCDWRGRVLVANHAARLELSAAGPLSMVDRLLRADARVANESFGAALRSAVFKGRRQLLSLEHSGRRLLVSVAPLTTTEAPGEYALVLFGRRRVCHEVALEMLSGLYELTRSERRVFGGLLGGATASALARSYGVALSTVRTQIASVRAKLGVSRIDGLTRLAAEMPPLTTALRCNVRSSG